MDLMPCSSPCVYQITRDNLGSAIQYASKNGVRYRYSYSPWGVRTHQVGGNTVFYQPSDDSPFGPFYRTYTGHEDLWMFGLINANARLYNPYLGRFISPDPLLNSEGGPLDYNPYIYARNNPYRYIDRNGEVGALVALGIAGLIGGGLNVWANWDDINNAGDFLLFFGVGAVSGVVGAAAVAMAPAGFFAGALYGAVGGGLSNAILGGGNAAILGQDVGSAIFTSAWQGAAMGFVLGGASGYISAKANGLNGWTGFEKSSNIMATRHRPVMTEPDAMAAMAETDEGLSQWSAPNIAKETGIQARQSSAAMHSNAGLLERTGKSFTTFTGEVYISKSDPHYLELLKEAQARYPNKAGHMQWHHIDPKYMGGASNGKLIQLDAAYHQMITNEFRSKHPFGIGPLDDNVRRRIMQKVYMKYPLPQ